MKLRTILILTALASFLYWLFFFESLPFDKKEADKGWVKYSSDLFSFEYPDDLRIDVWEFPYKDDHKDSLAYLIDGTYKLFYAYSSPTGDFLNTTGTHIKNFEDLRYPGYYISNYEDSIRKEYYILHEDIEKHVLDSIFSKRKDTVIISGKNKEYIDRSVKYTKQAIIGDDTLATSVFVTDWQLDKLINYKFIYTLFEKGGYKKIHYRNDSKEQYYGCILHRPYGRLYLSVEYQGEGEKLSHESMMRILNSIEIKQAN